MPLPCLCHSLDNVGEGDFVEVTPLRWQDLQRGGWRMHLAGLTQSPRTQSEATTSALGCAVARKLRPRAPRGSAWEPLCRLTRVSLGGPSDWTVARDQRPRTPRGSAWESLCRLTRVPVVGPSDSPPSASGNRLKLSGGSELPQKESFSNKRIFEAIAASDRLPSRAPVESENGGAHLPPEGCVGRLPVRRE